MTEQERNNIIEFIDRLSMNYKGNGSQTVGEFLAEKKEVMSILKREGAGCSGCINDGARICKADGECSRLYNDYYTPKEAEE